MAIDLVQFHSLPFEGPDEYSRAGGSATGVTGLDLKKGDRILFGEYSGAEIKLDGEEHLILREQDLLGVIEK